MEAQTTCVKTRLLGDMTNKVRDNNNTMVFHEIRVDKDIPDDIGALGKLRLIYNGISANAWLTPVGIRHIREPKLSYGGDSIPDELKNSIRDRAFSANSIMGRRHYELDRQELGKDEMICGVKMGDKNADEGRMNLKRETQSARRHKSRAESRRAYSGYEGRLVKSSHSRIHDAKSGDLPDLTITKILNGEGNSARDKEVKTSQMGNEGRKSVKIVEDEINRYKKLDALHEAYKARSKSFSAPPRKPEKEKPEVSRSSTSMQDYHPHHRGPTLKPLLCNESRGHNEHNDHCNESCKGCFRACLASDDFFEKAKTNEIPRPSAAVRVPRKRISYRLRPALRMAFLEQLVISKEPQPREPKPEQPNLLKQKMQQEFSINQSSKYE